MVEDLQNNKKCFDIIRAVRSNLAIGLSTSSFKWVSIKIKLNVLKDY